MLLLNQSIGLQVLQIQHRQLPANRSEEPQCYSAIAHLQYGGWVAYIAQGSRSPKALGGDKRTVGQVAQVLGKSSLTIVFMQLGEILRIIY